MIYELRNYHFDPERFEDYKAWARSEAAPYLREHMDIVDFWVDCGVPAEIMGAPLDDLGSANISWVIRWASKEERDAQFGPLMSSPEWTDIFSRVPGGLESYQRMEAKFFESL